VIRPAGVGAWLTGEQSVIHSATTATEETNISQTKIFHDKIFFQGNDVMSQERRVRN